MADVVWRPNGDVTRMHAIREEDLTIVGAHGLASLTVCGREIDRGVDLRGTPPPRCKRCVRAVERGR